MLLEMLSYAQKTLLWNWSDLGKQFEIKIAQNLRNKQPAALERLIPSKVILFYSYTTGLTSMIFSTLRWVHTARSHQEVSGGCAQTEVAVISGNKPPAGGNIYPSSRSSLAGDLPWAPVPPVLSRHKIWIQVFVSSTTLNIALWMSCIHTSLAHVTHERE